MASQSFADNCAHLVGVPYLFEGRTTLGADCIGIVLLGLAANGIRAVDPWEEIRRTWDKGWRPGDLPATRWRRKFALGAGTVLATGADGIITGFALDLGGSLALTALHDIGGVIIPHHRINGSVLDLLHWEEAE